MTVGGAILTSTKQMLNLVFGSCPKRKVCGYFQTESKTCVFGPFHYCGRYRSIVQPKNKIDATNETN
jgi:hypothetical protein